MSIRYIKQTRFGESEGNCFAACIACLFPIEIEDVPDFYSRYGSEWFDAFARWMNLFYVVPVMYSAEHKVPARDALHLMGGLSPRGIPHSVVGLNGAMIHDPHPSGAGLTHIEDYTFFICTLMRS